MTLQFSASTVQVASAEDLRLEVRLIDRDGGPVALPSGGSWAWRLQAPGYADVAFPATGRTISATAGMTNGLSIVGLYANINAVMPLGVIFSGDLAWTSGSGSIETYAVIQAARIQTPQNESDLGQRTVLIRRAGAQTINVTVGGVSSAWLNESKTARNDAVAAAASVVDVSGLTQFGSLDAIQSATNIPVTSDYIRARWVHASGRMVDMMLRRRGSTDPGHALSRYDNHATSRSWWEACGDTFTPLMNGASPGSAEAPTAFMGAFNAAVKTGRIFDGLGLDWVWNAAYGFYVPDSAPRIDNVRLRISAMAANSRALSIVGQTANETTAAITGTVARGATQFDVSGLGTLVGVHPQLKDGGLIRLRASNLWASKLPLANRVKMGEWVRIDRISGNTIYLDRPVKRDYTSSPIIVLVNVIEGTIRADRCGIVGPHDGIVGTAPSIAMGATSGLGFRYFESMIGQNFERIAGFGGRGLLFQDFAVSLQLENGTRENGDMETDISLGLGYVGEIAGCCGKAHVVNWVGHLARHVWAHGGLEGQIEESKIEDIRGGKIEKAIVDFHPNTVLGIAEGITGTQSSSSGEGAITSQAQRTRVNGVDIDGGNGLLFAQPMCSAYPVSVHARALTGRALTSVAVIVDLTQSTDCDGVTIEGDAEAERGIVLKSLPWYDAYAGTVLQGGSFSNVNISGAWKSTGAASTGALSIDVRKTVSVDTAPDCPSFRDFNVRGQFVRSNTTNVNVQIYTDTAGKISNGNFSANIRGGSIGLQGAYVSGASASIKLTGTLIISGATAATQYIHGGDLSADTSKHDLKIIAGV